MRSADTFAELCLRPPRSALWSLGFLLSLSLLGLLGLSLVVLFAQGVGVWGVNIPVAWGMAIVNFVWWIGIGHAGTLISAFLLLMRQGWRSSINRFAEMMTLMAVLCAGLFPLIHMGRPWLFFYLLPYPNHMGLWPQWRSPLVWDCFAVGTYFTVSLLFWYLGLVPDLAIVRDRASGRKRQIYGFFALGWRGSAYHWSLQQRAYLLLAAFATPLVLSVHSIVSIDFAFAIVPTWHSSIFPPYFVAGAILSGFAMVAMLAVPIRSFYHLEEFITLRHLDLMAKFMLVTSILVGYGYCAELFMAPDKVNLKLMGGLLFLNFLVPSLFWVPRLRRSPLAVFLLSLSINCGMWLERYVIVVDGLSRGFMQRGYWPTVWDWATFLGTFGLFFTVFLLFLRYVPMASIHEIDKDERSPGWPA